MEQVQTSKVSGRDLLLSCKLYRVDSQKMIEITVCLFFFLTTAFPYPGVFTVGL